MKWGTERIYVSKVIWQDLEKGLTEETQKNMEGKGAADGEHKEEHSKVTSSKFSDPKEFAAYLGIPFSSLQMLMKDHKERDPMV